MPNSGYDSRCRFQGPPVAWSRSTCGLEQVTCGLEQVMAAWGE